MSLKLAQQAETCFVNGARNYDHIFGSRFFEDEQVACYVSQYPVAWMNTVFKVSGSPSKELIRRTSKIFKDQSLPMTWYVGALTSEPELVSTILEEEGLKPSGTSVCMVLDHDKFSRSTTIPDLKIEKLCKEEMIKDWLTSFEISFEVPPNLLRHFDQHIRNRLGRLDDEVWFVAYLDGAPVSSLSYHLNNGLIMLYSVTTLPAFRLRGYAKQLMEVAIDHALHREKLPIALYASPMGLPVYKSMGFQEVYNWDHFTYEP
jgi:N-acetylglutamate synthase